MRPIFNSLPVIRVFIRCLTLALSVVQAVYPQSASQIAKKVFPSVVMLVLEDEYGQPLSFGSGFFVNSNVLATNLHVVTNSSNGYAKVVGKKVTYPIEGIVALDAEADIALLKIRGALLPPLKIGDSKLAEVGDEIFAVGNPEGLEGTFSQGIISGIRNVSATTLLQITAPISPGSSGGPVIDKKGLVIGIAFATFNNGQNLNFAIPSSYLTNLLLTMSDPKPLSSLRTNPPELFQPRNELGEEPNAAIIGDRFEWTYTGGCTGSDCEYTFSLHNRLQVNVSNVHCLVVFYDKESKPIDADVVFFKDTIPSGLAKRVKSYVDGSVFGLSTIWHKETGLRDQIPVEIRVLGFKLHK